MKCLSIKQPWAWAILNCGKDIENRRWRQGFRGEFLIHATRWSTSRDFDDACEFIYSVSGIEVPQRHLVEYGGIVGRATIVDCVDYHDSQWFEGPWGFVLENIVPIKFVPCKGSNLKFFDCPVEIEL